MTSQPIRVQTVNGPIVIAGEKFDAFFDPAPAARCLFINAKVNAEAIARAAFALGVQLAMPSTPKQRRRR